MAHKTRQDCHDRRAAAPSPRLPPFALSLARTDAPIPLPGRCLNRNRKRDTHCSARPVTTASLCRRASTFLLPLHAPWRTRANAAASCPLHARRSGRVSTRLTANRSAAPSTLSARPSGHSRTSVQRRQRGGRGRHNNHRCRETLDRRDADGVTTPSPPRRGGQRRQVLQRCARRSAHASPRGGWSGAIATTTST